MSPRRHAMAVLASRLAGLPRGSQKRLAVLAGVTPETVTRWKKARGNPRLSQLEALAEGLGVSLLFLISDDVPAERPTLPALLDAEARDRRTERALREAEAAIQAARSEQRRGRP